MSVCFDWERGEHILEMGGFNQRFIFFYRSTFDLMFSRFFNVFALMP